MALALTALDARSRYCFMFVKMENITSPSSGNHVWDRNGGHHGDARLRWRSVGLNDC